MRSKLPSQKILRRWKNHFVDFNNTERESRVKKIGIFLAIMGPGIITGSVDNDAGGITTYSITGAHYGYALLWTLVPSFIAILAVQEMNARIGIVTGKGLADLIRENFGVKVTFYIFICLLETLRQNLPVLQEALWYSVSANT